MRGRPSTESANGNDNDARHPCKVCSVLPDSTPGAGEDDRRTVRSRQFGRACGRNLSQRFGEAAPQRRSSVAFLRGEMTDTAYIPRHSQPHSEETREKIAQSRRRLLAELADRPAYCQRCRTPTMPRELVKSKGRWVCADCLCPPLPELEIEDFARAPSSAGQAMEEADFEKR
jgi:hypothetical protein